MSILYAEPLSGGSEDAGEAAEGRLAAYGMEKCATAIDVEDDELADDEDPKAKPAAG